MIRYRSFEQALTRVTQLRRGGIWPGIISGRDGTWRLTYDPGDTPDTGGEA